MSPKTGPAAPAAAFVAPTEEVLPPAGSGLGAGQEVVAGNRRWTAYMDVAELPQAPRNPKGHDLDGIRRAIERFGMADAVILDERTGRLIGGHGRREVLVTMLDSGQEPPDGVVSTEDGQWLVPVQRGWSSRSDREAEALLVALNRFTERGGWDTAGLADILEDLAAGGDDLLSDAGFDDGDLADMRAELATAGALGAADRDPDGNQPVPKGDLLALAGVTVGEPDYSPETGQVWLLGRHRLVCGDVHAGWSQWVPLLTSPDHLFWPYPSPLALFSEEAQQHPVVMVQPNLYLAGWIITKWARVTGETPQCKGSR